MAAGGITGNLGKYYTKKKIEKMKREYYKSKKRWEY